MAYKQLPIVQEEFATTKYANQIKDNFDAIVGSQILRESLTQLSNRLTSVAGQFVQYNEEIQRLITEFNSLKADVDKAIDAIDLRFNDLNADITKRIATLSDNLKELESSTGYNTNLHQYFKNVGQARNLVLAINKLHEDLGDPRNLTTNLKENVVTAINEITLLLGVLEDINEEIKGDTFVETINNLSKKLKLNNGKNIKISSENNIDVLGGVNKDYIEEVQYYKNDFIWKDNTLYKVIKDFISTSFESDLDVNVVEVKTGGDGNVNQSAVVNTYKEETVFEEGDLILVTEDLDDPQNPINIDIINKAVPVGCTYIQFANEMGQFLEEESPSFLYPNTQWELMFNTESVYFRTEGSLSESSRSNGLQGDAGRNATGAVSNYVNSGNTFDSGVLYAEGYENRNFSYGNNFKAVCLSVALNLSKQWTTANEFRTRNRLIRIYKRIS